MTSGQWVVDALSTYIYRPLERFLESHPTSLSTLPTHQPNQQATMSTYKPTEVSVAAPSPRRHHRHTRLHHHSPRSPSFLTRFPPLFFENAPFSAENAADSSTTASSRTEPPTSGCPASMASADRKSLSFTPSPLPAACFAKLISSDGPDPHVEGAKGGKASGSTGESYKPSEHDGLKKDGTEDKRLSSEHGFGGS